MYLEEFQIKSGAEEFGRAVEFGRVVVEIFLPPHIFMSRAQWIAPHGINSGFIRRNPLRPTLLTTNW
jgi:hypothetical protein